VAEGAHEAIVEPSLWRRAQPGTRAPRQSDVHVLAGGILRCGTCGRALTPSGDRYRCRRDQVAGPDCDAPASAKVAEADALVEWRLFADQAAKDAPAPDLTPLELALADSRARYEQLLATDLLSIDPGAFSAKAAELKGAVEAAEDALDAARREADRGSGPEGWDEMTAGERRRWLAGAGVTVLVEPGRKPLSERARFVVADPKEWGAAWRAAWRRDAGLEQSAA
jgi:hypothetical protein